MLKHHLDSLPVLAGARLGNDRAAIEAKFPGGGSEQAHDHTAQRGLSAAGLACQPYGLTGLDLEVYASDGRHLMGSAAEHFGEVA